MEAKLLLDAVADFIAGLTLEGRDAFHARVAVNALAIVAREIEQDPAAAEAQALSAFGGPAALCAGLRDGTLDLDTPGLLDALVTANLARLAVDNPRYATFVRRSAPKLDDAAVQR